MRSLAGSRLKPYGPISMPPMMMPTMPGRRMRSESSGMTRMMVMMTRKKATGSWIKESTYL